MKHKQHRNTWGLRQWLAIMLAVVMAASILPGDASFVQAAEILEDNSDTEPEANEDISSDASEDAEISDAEQSDDENMLPEESASDGQELENFSEETESEALEPVEESLDDSENDYVDSTAASQNVEETNSNDVDTDSEDLKEAEDSKESLSEDIVQNETLQTPDVEESPVDKATAGSGTEGEEAQINEAASDSDTVIEEIQTESASEPENTTNIEEEAQEEDAITPSQIEMAEDTADVLNDGEYTVNLNPNGGAFSDKTTASKSISVDEYDSVDLEDYEPTRINYVFLGWAFEKNATTTTFSKYSWYYPSSYSSTYGTTQTLYAIWQKGVTITLDANGGTFSSVPDIYSGSVSLSTDKKTAAITVTKNRYLSIYDYPIRSNKALLGWSTSKSATTTETSKSLYITAYSNKMYYAVCGDMVTITLKANGGKFPSSVSSSGNTTTVSSDKSTLTIKAAKGDYVYLYSYPTKSKKLLRGWGTSAKATEPASGSSESLSMRMSANTTYYAIWADIVTITLKANGGKFPSTVSSSGSTTTVSSDKKTMTIKAAKGTDVYVYSSSLPTRSGKALRGWGTSAKATEPVDGSEKDFSLTVSASKTYYAIWTASVNVTFKSADSMVFYSDGKYVSSLTVPVAKGDTLYDYTPSVYVKTKSGSTTSYNYLSSSNTKWATSKSTKVANAFFAYNYKVTAKKTFYPVNAATVKIKWDANGGKINTAKSVSVTETFGRSISSPTAPTRSGKTFIGWSATKKASGLVDFENTVYALKNTTYYAIWESGYKITIKGNGGTFSYCYNGTLSNDKKTMTAYVRKGGTLGSFYFSVTKDGKVLNGLATTAKGKAIKNRYSYRPSSAMTFYAVPSESASTYEVTYNANGGTFSDGSKVKKVEEEKGDYLWTSATRTGYELLGWYTAKKGGKRVTTVTKKMTVYAHWKKALTVTWNANGGSFSHYSYSPKTVDYVSKNSILNNHRHTVYSSSNSKGFAGWSTSKKGSIIDLRSYKVTKSMTLYAIWESGDDLADGRIVLSKKRFVYTGKPVKPAITVYDRDGKKVSSSQYTVTYEDNNGAGDAHIQIRGRGKKSGTKRMSFYINYDARSNVSSAKASGKTIKVSYSKATAAVQYEVYAQNVNTGAIKSVTSKTTSATIKKLGKGTYNVYVIPWTTSGEGDGTYRSSGWRAGTMKKVTVK